MTGPSLPPLGQLTVTRSVCATCRRLVQARVVRRVDGIWFEKFCPDHGRQDVKVADDAEAYLDAHRYHRVASRPLEFATAWRGRCPDDCGLCPEHEQHVCMPIIEITDHCDMHCPICLVQNANSWHMTRAELERLLDRLIAAEERIDVVNLSGGEPTCHPQFREMVEACLARPEILRVSVSTNGRHLVGDDALLRFLAERRVVVSLQFDGTEPGYRQALRGCRDARLDLLDRLTALEAPCSLTFTLAPAAPEAALAEAVEALFTRPNVLSLMIQPAAYVGRGQRFGATQSRRIFMPEAIDRVARASRGRVRPGNFSPLPCSHPNCFSLSFFLRAPDGTFVSLKELFAMETYLDLIRNRTLFGTDPENFGKIEAAVYDLWSGPAALAPDSEKALGAVRRLLRQVQSSCPGGCFEPAHLLAVAERQVKSIFVHAFMDPGTFDLTRVRKCCKVYPLRDGRFVPACVYNVRGRSAPAA
jgi:uncharacterized radical SAM superfamily Fe-S cluster-containing enzyme